MHFVRVLVSYNEAKSFWSRLYCLFADAAIAQRQDLTVGVCEACLWPLADHACTVMQYRGWWRGRCSDRLHTQFCSGSVQPLPSHAMGVCGTSTP
jgi:hypothetical protein